MIKTHIEFDDTDVARILKKIITGDCKDEMVKLLTPIICDEHHSVKLLAKIFIGHKLPNIIPEGTFCRIKRSTFYISPSKEQLYKDNVDDNDELIGTIKDFRGYHKDMYGVAFKLKEKDGSITEDYSYISICNIEVIKEF